MTFRRGRRYKLGNSLTSENGVNYQEGQVFTIMSWDDELQMAVVRFTGYEDERAKADAYFKEKGDVPNVLPWIAPIPYDAVTEI